MLIITCLSRVDRYLLSTEAATSYKKGVLKNFTKFTVSQNSQENNCVGVYFLIKNGGFIQK